jgi:hypothetical protein
MILLTMLSLNQILTIVGNSLLLQTMLKANGLIVADLVFGLPVCRSFREIESLWL